MVNDNNTDEQLPPAEEINTEMDINTALLFYKNFQEGIADNIDRLASPFNYDKNGKATKRKNEAKKTGDLYTLATVFRAVVADLEAKPNQFNEQRAKDLYGHIMAVIKSKEIIRADLRIKLLNNDESVNAITDEAKQQLLKGL